MHAEEVQHMPVVAAEGSESSSNSFQEDDDDHDKEESSHSDHLPPPADKGDTEEEQLNEEIEEEDDDSEEAEDESSQNEEEDEVGSTGEEDKKPKAKLPVKLSGGKHTAVSPATELKEALVDPETDCWPNVMKEAKEGKFSLKKHPLGDKFTMDWEASAKNVEMLPPEEKFTSDRKCKELSQIPPLLNPVLDLEMAQRLVKLLVAFSQAAAVFHIQEEKEFPQGKGWANVIASVCGKCQRKRRFVVLLIALLIVIHCDNC